MNAPSATVGAGLSILALGFWLSLGGREGAPEVKPQDQAVASLEGADPYRPLDAGEDRGDGDVVQQVRDRGTGSALPCRVPLSWRIARIDDGFGIDDGFARSAVEDAAALWEEAVGRPLFSNDPTWGFPIRFVYDERQTSTRAREQAEEAYRAEGRMLDSMRTVLEEAARAHGEARRDYQEQAEAFQRRVNRHNVLVREWNVRGGAPAAVLEELQEEEEALDAARAELEATSSRLEEELRALEEDESRFNRRWTAYDRRGGELERAYPTASIQSGLYREEVMSENGRPVSAEREIRIFRFSDAEDLRLVVAHELGHALGLGHVEGPNAVMSEQYTREVGADAAMERTAVRPMDLELFRETCPEL